MERLELFEREQRGERNMTCLRNAISSLYDGVFPLYLSNNQIWKDLQGSFENPEDLTYKSWRAVLYWIKRIRDEEFLSDPFLSNKTLAIPEWFARSDAETIKGGKKELGDWFIELFTKYDNENDNEMPGHTLGGIWLEQKGDYVVFSYPRIPYADYSWITKEIFSLKSRRTDNIKIDCRRSSEICNTQGDNAPLYQFFPNGKKKYCTIQMTTDSKRNNVLRHSAYFLIDFIVGYLASFHNSTGAYSDNIRAALNKLKHCCPLKVVDGFKS